MSDETAYYSEGQPSSRSAKALYKIRDLWIYVFEMKVEWAPSLDASHRNQKSFSVWFWMSLQTQMLKKLDFRQEKLRGNLVLKTSTFNISIGTLRKTSTIKYGFMVFITWTTSGVTLATTIFYKVLSRSTDNSATCVLKVLISCALHHFQWQVDTDGKISK